MEKLIYLVWDRPSTDRSALREQMLGDVAPALLEHGAERLQVHLDDDSAALDGPMPPPGSELPIRAAFSFFVEAHDRRHPLEAAIAALGVRTAGYLVAEALVVDYGDNGRHPPRDWAAGERSPVMSTFTVLRRNPALDPRTFRELWFGHQSPMAGEVQPQLRYVRNTVVHAVTPGALPYDGIVHESFPTEAVADPIALHGGPDVGEENLRVMLDSVSQVFDLATLRSVAMSEYLY